MKLIHLALGGALVLLGATLDRLYERRCQHRQDDLLDESLDATYPASDPTATQDFSAPEERSAGVVRPTPGRLH
ncbi:MAG: hypothetical protein U1F39_15465 [Steroidobacteraceae bacterium]